MEIKQNQDIIFHWSQNANVISLNFAIIIYWQVWSEKWMIAVPGAMNHENVLIVLS